MNSATLEAVIARRPLADSRSPSPPPVEVMYIEKRSARMESHAPRPVWTCSGTR